MKSRKSYGRKIKRTRTNLYRKKKTRRQMIAGTVFTVILLAAVAFLGYCLGKPLLEFLEKNAGREEPEWTPPVITTTAPAEQSEQPAEITTEEKPIETQLLPETTKKLRAVTAPKAALQNSASLSAFAVQAKNDGYSAVVLDLKDENGYFHYASEAALSRSEELVVSDMTAGEIASVLKEAGLHPIGAVCALRDNAGCAANPDMSYKIVNEGNICWLDYSTGSPQRWANPDFEATREYVSEIVSELTDAGISVMLREVVFPDLQEYDRQYIAAEYFEESRSALLLPLVAENMPVEMLAEDILADGFGRTAELLRERGFTDAPNTVAVRISRNSFLPENGYPADASGLVEEVLARVREKTVSLAVIPVIERAGFSEAEIGEIKELLGDGGYVIV